MDEERTQRPANGDPFFRRPVAFLLVGLLLGGGSGVVLGLLLAKDDSPRRPAAVVTVTPTPTPSPLPVATRTVPGPRVTVTATATKTAARPAHDWEKIIEFANNTSDTSDTFYVTKVAQTWRICWEYDGTAHFKLTVVESGSSPLVTVVDKTGPTKDCKRPAHYGPGKLPLQMEVETTSGDWFVSAEWK